MTQIILEQRTRGSHSFIRDVGVAGERLKEGLELEVRPEGIRWPLCGELVQFVSDSFGGHCESCRGAGDQRSSKLVRNGDKFARDNPSVHFGLSVPSFNFLPWTG